MQTNRVSRHWPAKLLEIRDFREIANTEAEELEQAQKAVDKLLADQFIETACKETILRRERELGIQYDPETETLEFRRNRLINRYSTKPPFTLRFLQQQLDDLVGRGRTNVTVDVQNFILTVEAAITDANVFKEVEHTVNVIKPANLVYQQRTALIETIGLDEKISRQDVTWNYKLDGSWKLGEKPFATLGPEVPVK